MPRICGAAFAMSFEASWTLGWTTILAASSCLQRDTVRAAPASVSSFSRFTSCNVVEPLGSNRKDVSSSFLLRCPSPLRRKKVSLTRISSDRTPALSLSLSLLNLSIVLDGQAFPNMLVHVFKRIVQGPHISSDRELHASVLLKKSRDWPLRAKTCHDFVRRASSPVRSRCRPHAPLRCSSPLRPTLRILLHVASQHLVNHLVPGFNVSLRLWVVGRTKHLPYLEIIANLLDDGCGVLRSSVSTQDGREPTNIKENLLNQELGDRLTIISLGRSDPTEA